ncbi:MAG: retroviral-like aspartic protease family protein [Kiritimatiellae bacterium]|nr:retroviral-like aspartic protease family protein [Kiritimatiellia bacterium]
MLTALAACRQIGEPAAPWMRGPNADRGARVMAGSSGARGPAADGVVLYWEGGPNGADAPVVRVAVNGRLVLALVDTGSTITLLESSAARRCGVAAAADPMNGATNKLTPWSGQGLGASFCATAARIRELRLGDWLLTNVPVGIADAGGDPTRPFAGGRSRAAELILGVDVVRGAGRLGWDGRRGAIVLGGAAVLRETETAVAIPLVENSWLPVLRIEVDGRYRMHAVLDTGSEFALYVPGPLSRTVGLPPPRGRAVLAHGMGGRVVAHAAGEVELSVGGMGWGRVPLWIGATGQGHANLPFALIGRGAFERRRWVLDFEQGRLWVVREGRE